MYFDEYIQAVSDAVDEVYEGIDRYAVELDDLSGNVFDPLSKIRELTDEAELPGYIDADEILGYVTEAEDGAERYAETLEDTTDCTHPLDKLLEYLGID